MSAKEALERDAVLKREREAGIARDRHLVDQVVLEAARRIEAKGCYHSYRDGFTRVSVDDVTFSIHHDYRAGDTLSLQTSKLSEEMHWHCPTQEAQLVFLKAFADWRERCRSGQLHEAVGKLQPPEPPRPRQLEILLAWIDRRFFRKASAAELATQSSEPPPSPSGDAA